MSKTPELGRALTSSVKASAALLKEAHDLQGGIPLLTEEDIEVVLQDIDGLSFDIFRIREEDLHKLVERTFQRLGLFEEFPISRIVFRAFVHAIQEQYQPNTYHNFRHACDVVHAMYLMLTQTEAGPLLTSLEKLAAMLGALCHDVDHPGLTNAFLVAAKDPLAIRYNDFAVLESHHAATMFKTMQERVEVDVLGQLSEGPRRHLRKLIVAIILATDMGQHSETVAAFAARMSDPRPFEQTVVAPPTPPQAAAAPAPAVTPPRTPQLKIPTSRAASLRPSPRPSPPHTARSTHSSDATSSQASTSKHVTDEGGSHRSDEIQTPQDAPSEREERSSKGESIPSSRKGSQPPDKGVPRTPSRVSISRTQSVVTSAAVKGPAKTPRESRASNNFSQSPPATTVPPNPALHQTTSSTDALLLMRMLIKCADISNLIKPFFLSKRWAALLLLEWFQQGDTEKRLGLPISKFMDREDSTTLMAMTCGCIDFIAKPMYETAARQIPALHTEAIPNMLTNRKQWMLFSTNGRRGSATAADILGPLYPFGKRPDDDATSVGSIDMVPSELDLSLCATPAGGQFVPLAQTTMSAAPLSLLFGNKLRSITDQGRRHTASAVARGMIMRSNSQLALELSEHSRGEKDRDHRGDNDNLFVTSPRSRLGAFDTLAELNQGRLLADGVHKSALSADLNHETGNRRPSHKMMSFRNIGRPRTLLESIRESWWAVYVERFLNGTIMHTVMLIATFCSLFSSDITIATLPKSWDPAETYILVWCLCTFILESILLSVFQVGYFFSFFFWLDMIATIALVPDITGLISTNLVIARAGRAARAGTRASRLLRFVRLARVVNIGRITHSLWQPHKGRMDAVHEFDEVDTSKPSNVWRMLSDLTTQKLIIGVMLMLIIMPLLRQERPDRGPPGTLTALDGLIFNTQVFNRTLEELTAFNTKFNYKLVYLGVRVPCPPSSHYQGNLMGYCTSNLSFVDYDAVPYVQLVPKLSDVPNGRDAVKKKFREPKELLYATSIAKRCEAYYDISAYSKKDAWYNITLTLFVLVLLATWSFLLSRDSNRILIQPIERMVSFVKELADDPVSFVGKSSTGDANFSEIRGLDLQLMETSVVELALLKIASLTKVVLGEAGLDILSVNLKGSEFNPMIPGKKIRACFGFCDIRNFTDATECLQEDVMMFVNKIAEVVHGKVVMHHGSPNKNIGDAFLIVWKKSISDSATKTGGTTFADRALRSFLDCIQAVESSQTLAEYAKHPAIQKRMPGYKIKMGFGLHVGWAIEGAIGSRHKVDPSYLSPHVNMASRLEAATKQYGVVLLISETVVDNLTKTSLRGPCRKLDRVTVKGSAHPLSLFTYDIPMYQRDLKEDPAQYKERFEAGVNAYIAGDWAVAVEKLKECQKIWPTDKPAQVLLNYMSSLGNRSPHKWQGFRELTEK